MTEIDTLRRAVAPEEYEGLLKDILSAPQVMIWLADPQFNFFYGNQTGLDFYGFSLEEFKSANWMDYVHPEDAPQIERCIGLALREHPVIKQEYRAKNRTGKYAHILDICSPRFSPDGEFIGYLGSIVDITERKSRESPLKGQFAKISEWEQNRVGKDLHDGLAHALLGTSLKAMILENKLKKRDLPEFFIAKEISEQTSRVLANLRKLSRTLFPSSLSRLEFEGALKAVAETLGEAQGIFVVVAVDLEAVPRDPERALLLFRIAQEGMLNAARHGRAKRIDVGVRMDGSGRCTLEVKDDGVGLSGNPRAAGGLGWRLIDHRAEVLEADVEFSGTRKGGTVLRCHYRLVE